MTTKGFATSLNDLSGARPAKATALLVRIMSDCLLRVGEASALDCSDIDFVGDWLQVVVRSSKTDQEGRGVALYAGPRRRGWRADG